MWITNEDFPIAGFLVCTSQNIITILKHSLMNEPLETQRDSSKLSTNIKHIQTVLLKFLFFSLEFLRVFHTHIFPDFFFILSYVQTRLYSERYWSFDKPILRSRSKLPLCWIVRAPKSHVIYSCEFESCTTKRGREKDHLQQKDPENSRRYSALGPLQGLSYGWWSKLLVVELLYCLVCIAVARTIFLASHLCVATASPLSTWCLHATVAEDSILYFQSYCQSPQPGERNRNITKSYHKFKRRYFLK